MNYYASWRRRRSRSCRSHRARILSHSHSAHSHRCGWPIRNCRCEYPIQILISTKRSEWTQTYDVRFCDCMNVGQQDRTPLIRWIMYGKLLQIFWINNTMRRCSLSILSANRNKIFYSLFVAFKSQNVNGGQWIGYNYTFYVGNTQYRWTTRRNMLVCSFSYNFFLHISLSFQVSVIEWNNKARCSHNYSNGNGLKGNLTIFIFPLCARESCTFLHKLNWIPISEYKKK